MQCGDEVVEPSMKVEGRCAMASVVLREASEAIGRRTGQRRKARGCMASPLAGPMAAARGAGRGSGSRGKGAQLCGALMLKLWSSRRMGEST